MNLACKKKHVLLQVAIHWQLVPKARTSVSCGPLSRTVQDFKEVAFMLLVIACGAINTLNEHVDSNITGTRTISSGVIQIVFHLPAAVDSMQ